MRRLFPLVLFALCLPVAADDGPTFPEGFVPIEQAVPYTVAEEGARRPGFIGVSLDRTSTTTGCEVTSVVDGSSADSAGIQTGDIIVSFDRISTPNGSQLIGVVRSKVEGESIRAVLYRDGERLVVPIVMREVEGRLMLGIRFDASVPVVDHGGVMIAEVVDDSPAARAELVTGDVIVAFDGTPTPDPDALGTLARTLREGDSTRLTIRRGEEVFDVDLDLAGRGNERRAREREPWTSFKLAVVLVEFEDVKHDERFTVADMDTMFFSQGIYNRTNPSGQTVYGSVVDFYEEISCGAFQLEGKVFDWVAVDAKKEDYKNQNMGGREGSGFLQAAIEAIQARDGEDALAGYQGLAVVYAGTVDHPRGRVLWPHRSNVRVGRQRLPYYIMSELSSRRGSFAGIGTHCHEFGHMLNLPDQYSEIAGQGVELGRWCLMANGEDGTRRSGGDRRPFHPCPWCKIQVGWLSPRMIDPRVEQKLILGPIEGSSEQCLKIPLREDASEYLLVSYRGGLGNHAALRTGVLVWHVSLGNQVDLLEAHGEQSSNRRFQEVPFPSGDTDTLIVDEQLADLKTHARGRWRVRIANIREQDGHALLEIGPVE